MPQDNRSTPIEYQTRVDIVKGMLVKAVEIPDIVKACLKLYPDWDVGKRQIKNYIYSARHQLHRDAKQIDFEAELLLSKLQINYSIKLALSQPGGANNRDFQNAIKMKIDLLGLQNLRYEPEWKETARQAGFDPDELLFDSDELLQQFMGSDDHELILLDEYSESMADAGNDDDE